jgi:transcriptional regulator with XRE-family HTH domain
MKTISRRAVALAFGDTLRAARAQRGVSQDHIAEVCEIDRSYQSLLERGLRVPTLFILLRLAESLSVTPESLVTGTVQRLREARQ